MEVNKHINFLKRRGLLIEESSQLSLDLPIEEFLNFKLLCSEGSDVFCKLVELADEHGIKDDPVLSRKLVDSITKIYKYLRPPIKNNRSKFNRLISVILDQKLENAINTFDIIANVIDDVNIGDLRKSISQLTDSEIELGDDVLLKIINDIKYQTYTKYENSFIGDHFESYRTRLELDITGSEVLNETFTKVLLRVIDGKISKDLLVNTLYNNILDNFKQGKGKFIKADLKCKKPLTDENGNVIINNGEYVEVKKLDYKGDSYLSEFFAIYKNPDKLPDILKTDEGLLVYNNIIDSLFLKLSGSASGIIDSIHDSFAGIIYDENRFIPSKYIKLYWSNKGQRNDDHRLSIRYKVISNKFLGYIYDSGSDVLKTEKISIDASPNLIMLPLTVNESINEDTVTDKGGKDWDRYSPQGKMIRTKGGTVPLDNGFDWARRHISDIPATTYGDVNPYVEALIKVLGADKVVGVNFEELTYGNENLYGLKTFKLHNGEKWAVGKSDELYNAKWNYNSEWLNDMSWDELPNVENYLELPYHWITDYAEDVSGDMVYDMDDDEIIEAWVERDNDYYKYEIKEIKKFEEDLEGDISNLDDEINSLNNRMSDMETKNQDYLSYGYEEPQFTEEDFENIVNRIEELMDEREKTERYLEKQVDDRWYDLIQDMKHDLEIEFRREIEDEIERGPIGYFSSKGYGNPISVIRRMDWSEYIDIDSIVDDFTRNTESHQLSPYGKSEVTEINGTQYTLLKA